MAPQGILGALSAGVRTNGSVPVSALDRRSNRRRLAMPDQLRGSRNASLLNARRTTCSLFSLPISSGSCPLRAFLCAAAAGLKSLRCYCMQGCIARAVVSRCLVNPLRSDMRGGLPHCAPCVISCAVMWRLLFLRSSMEWKCHEDF